jgi:hypothetical protein
MSTRWLKHIPATLAALGLLFAVFMVVPACFAGGAATIVPDKHQLAPRGSYIPDRRVKQVLKKVNEYKAMMEKKKALEQEERSKENKVPEP